MASEDKTENTESRGKQAFLQFKTNDIQEKSLFLEYSLM